MARPLLLGQAAELVATGFGSGRAPVAPATMASLVAVAIYYFLPVSGWSPVLYLMVAAGFLLGVAATGVLVTPADPDPRRAVWDEFVGMWATCLFLPKELPWLAAAFLCFRALDVLKPWPIRRLESLPRGWGIMADDLAAGLAGAALLNLIRWQFFS